MYNHKYKFVSLCHYDDNMWLHSLLSKYYSYMHIRSMSTWIKIQEFFFIFGFKYNPGCEWPFFTAPIMIEYADIFPPFFFPTVYRISNFSAYKNEWVSKYKQNTRRNLFYAFPQYWIVIVHGLPSCKLLLRIRRWCLFSLENRSFFPNLW